MRTGFEDAEREAVRVSDLMTGELRAVEQGDIRARLTVKQRKDATPLPAVVIPDRVVSPELLEWVASH